MRTSNEDKLPILSISADDHPHNLITNSHSAQSLFQSGRESPRLLSPTFKKLSKWVTTDKYMLVYIILSFLGAGQLWTYNTLVTVPDYFDKLFPNADLEFWIPAVLNYPSLIFLLLMAWKGNVLSLRIRILMSFIVCGFANILIPVLGAYLGSTSVSLGFVVLLIFFAGTGTSVVQSSLFGFASSFPSLYTQALMGGNGIAGFVVTLMRVFSKLIYKDDENVTMKSANLFFGIAAGFSMLCFLLFLVMERIPFARRFLDKLKHKKVDRLPALEESEDSSMLAYSEDENVISDSESIVEQEEPEYYKVSPLQVLKKVWKNGLVVCSVFTLTFMIFPGITSKLQSSTSFVSSEWYTLILFVQFNFFDLIGRTLPSYKILFTPKTLWIVSLGRFAFYPLFVLNLKGIFFVHDAWSLTFMALFALTNGYVASLAMIYGPSFVENDQDKETAGVIMAFFLNFGIFLGSHIALIMKLLGIGN